MKMLISEEWMRRKILEDGDIEAGMPLDSETAMGKRLSDDPGLAEMKRMEYLMSKAPCIARLKELTDWSEKKD